MSDAIISAILSELVKTLHEDAKQFKKLLSTVKDEVENIKRNLKTIQVVIEDAEEKEFGSDKRIQLWLDRLREEAHKIEDVLDDWKAAHIGGGDPEAATNAKAKVLLSCFSSCFGQVVKDYNIATRISEINTKLDNIAKEKKDFGLVENHQNNKVRMPGRVQSTSFDVDESCLHGREEIKPEIIKCCLSSAGENNSSGVKIISVVGMGGVGKTTLAQLVFNDSQIKQTFGSSRVWVCVSDVFDVRSVAVAIIEELGDEKVVGFEQSQLQRLLERVGNSVRKNKFFLVLDDVWEDDKEKWQCLINVLNTESVPGSCILLTTRKETAAKMHNDSQIFPLGKLSEADCWKILSQLAFSGRDAKEREELEDVGKRISKRCKGLPLTAKALGKLLGSKSTKEEWEGVLNNEIWKLDVVEREIFAPLLLSYYDLPPPVRQCFKYCVTYRKDEVYLQSDLIYEWMALGYLQMNDDLDQQRGVEYFKFLVSRSFFQDVKMYDETNKVMSCKMHDIVHEFGQFLTKNDDQVVTKEIKFVKDNDITLSSKTRHLTLFVEENKYLSVSITGAEKLHSLSITNSMSEDSLRGIFKQAKRVRMIKLHQPVETGYVNVPEEIENMVHLSYFRLWAPNKTMTLPDSMRKLRNLQYLNLKFHDGLIPKWIGELVNLRELIGVVVSGKDHREGFSLGDLKNMKQLRVLGITFEGCNPIVGEEVKRAEFDKKMHLKVMKVFLVGDEWDKASVTKALKLPSRVNLVFTKDDYHTIDGE